MKRSSFIGIILVLVIVALFFVNFPVGPPPNTRIILEHTYKTYISPPCYEQAQKTNNLAEETLQKAKLLNYKPESSCTEKSLQEIQQPIVYIVAEKMGLKKSKWEW